MANANPLMVQAAAAPEVARLTALATIRAAAMGLIEAADALDATDPAATERLLRGLRRAGIGRGMVGSPGPEELCGLLEAMEASPAPEWEWPAVERVLGAELLTELLDISHSSLKRYQAGTRPTPDDVAARLHFLALVAGDLAGSYNDLGIRRWFGRRRSLLDGATPADLLRGGWDPEDEGPARVRSLAASLLEGQAA